MVTTVEAALDAGLFYDTDIHRAVLEGMGGPGCQPVLLREVDLALGDRATERAICEEVKRSPRGTYAILRYHRDDGYVYHRAPMADGTGDLSGHGTNDPFDPTDPAAPAHTLDRMVGYEIYKCRHAVGEARERAKNLAALAATGFTVGQRLTHPLCVGRHTYSSATIVEISPTEGWVVLEMVKRGSPRRPRTTMGAAILAEDLAAPAVPR
jgi:hypothetical protein